MPRIQHKRGTSANLASVNPTPLAGELVWDSSENAIKIGDGSTAWSSLAYVTATPRSHTHDGGEITTGTVAYARLPVGSTASTVCAGDDARLTAARMPTAHKTSHATGGSDALSPGDIGAVPAASPTFTGVILADVSTSTSAPVYSFTGDPNCGIAHPAADTVVITTSGTERIRFDSGGKILVGTFTSRSAGPAVPPVFQFEGTTAGAVSYQCICGSTNAAVSPQIILARHRGAVGESAIVSDGDSLGLIRFNGGDGTDCVSIAAQIECRVDGTPGVNDMPGSLRFHTTAGGFQSAGERMRITSAGLVGIATTAPSATLDVNANTMRLRTARTPASATATGNAGDICWDANYLYIAVATNTWRRISHASW